MDNILTNLFDAMTRDELRVLAKVLGLKQGRNKADTCIAIEQAIKEGKAQLEYVAFIMSPPVKGILRSKTLFMKKIPITVIEAVFLPEEKETAVPIDMAMV